MRLAHFRGTTRYLKCATRTPEKGHSQVGEVPLAPPTAPLAPPRVQLDRVSCTLGGATRTCELHLRDSMTPRDWWRDRLLLLANRLLLLANVLYCTPVLYVLLHVLLLYFNVLYIVAYSTYFRCILLYSMYSAEGECTLMYLGVLCCVF